MPDGSGEAREEIAVVHDQSAEMPDGIVALPRKGPADPASYPEVAGTGGSISPTMVSTETPAPGRHVHSGSPGPACIM